MFSKFLLALSFLTIVPVGRMQKTSPLAWAKSVFFYPICGYIIAFLVLLLPLVLSYFGGDGLLLAGITVALLAIITGAIHLDGFADLCDGFFCPVDSKERRIEIMRDPHVGSFGVVGLILLLLIKFVSLAVIFERGGSYFEIAAVIVFARFFIVLLAKISKPVSGKGIGAYIVGKVSGRSFFLTVLFILPCLFSDKMIVVFLLLLSVTLFLRFVSNRRIGGVTGDVLGACCEICETFGFLIIVL